MGLILQVVPRISPDGLVVMQITANKSQVSNDAGIPISISTNGQVVTAPRIDVSQALTTVSALSGQTVVLGGLLETTKSDVHRRVPIIADIPLIGDLFRYDSVTEERRELLIILTPQIIYNKMDSDLVKQIESSRMSWILVGRDQHARRSRPAQPLRRVVRRRNGIDLSELRSGRGPAAAFEEATVTDG